MVFHKVDALMQNISKALSILGDEEYQNIALLPTKARKPYFKKGEDHWRLMEYIRGTTTYDITENPEIAFEAGRIIGRFHVLMQDEPVQEYQNIIPDFHNLSLRHEQFKDAHKKAKQDRMAQAAGALKTMENIYGWLKNHPLQDLPLRVCHNDTKLNNILFSKRAHKALCLIDLDTLMAGHFLYDFGDALRTIANTAAEDEKNLKDINFNRERFTAFLRGLAQNPPFLKATELEHLPLGVIYMPFIHGLRALTDYFEEDRYYKVSYPTQNLDRALSLLEFSKKALEELPFMQTEVGRILA